MKFKELRTSDATLTGLSNINLILGRNGAGKSRFLRDLNTGLGGDDKFQIRYISPERAGVFRKDANIQNKIQNSVTWLRDVRNKNQADNFKAASAALLGELELTYLRRLESSPELRADPERTFRLDRLEKINRLLLNVALCQEGSDLVFRSLSGDLVPPDQISSGESEAVALAAEIMHFFDGLSAEKFNLLLLDEPDVHLHPDLQARLARLLIGELNALEAKVKETVAVCIATHSTSLVCALADSPETTIGSKRFGSSEVEQARASDSLMKSAPFFGHPLSLSLSQDVALIVEGEDDERVWQQAAKSSNGRIKLFPIVASSVNQLTKLERACGPLLAALYDDPIAYSVRDGDGKYGELQNEGPIVRFRLVCYAIENTLLTDECLAVMETTWPKFKEAAKEWIDREPMHLDIEEVQKLLDASDRLRHVKIKKISQLICSIVGKTKPWEVVVGQALAGIDITVNNLSETSLMSYVGQKACVALLPPPAKKDSGDAATVVAA